MEVAGRIRGVIAVADANLTSTYNAVVVTARVHVNHALDRPSPLDEVERARAVRMVVMMVTVVVVTIMMVMAMFVLGPRFGSSTTADDCGDRNKTVEEEFLHRVLSGGEWTLGGVSNPTQHRYISFNRPFQIAGFVPTRASFRCLLLFDHVENITRDVFEVTWRDVPN